MAASGAVGEGTLELDDGRALGYAEYGQPDGAPIVYLHGLPGSRLDPAALDQEYRQLGARVVALERPGYGLSTRRRSWGLLDWPTDVAAGGGLLRPPRLPPLRSLWGVEKTSPPVVAQPPPLPGAG